MSEVKQNLVLKHQQDILSIFKNQSFILETNKSQFIVNKELAIFNLHSFLLQNLLDKTNEINVILNKIKDFFSIKEKTFEEKLVLTHFSDQDGNEYYVLNSFNDRFIIENELKTSQEFYDFLFLLKQEEGLDFQIC